MFDSTDDLDRLLIEYGHKYTWNEWQAVVRRRLKIHMSNHTICSYQIHGWVAGAAAEEPMEERGWRAVPGWRDAAKDCFAMLRFFLEQAHRNKLPVKTATEINDWWRTRTYDVEILSTEISMGDVIVKIFNKTQKTVYGFVVQVCLPQGARVKDAFVNGRSIDDFELWTENNYDKIIIPFDLQPGTSKVKLNINFP